MMRYILVIDEGTTSVRVALFDTKKNKIVKLVRKEINLIYPHPEWVEMDALDVWNKTKACLLEITKNINTNDIYGLGITNQRETTIAWDKKTGKPLHNAIVWQCRRTKNIVENLAKSKLNNLIYKKTGLIPNSYFSATKMQWLLQNVKEVKQAAKANNLCFGTVESFLTFKLTNGKKYVTDITNASRTMLLNIKTLKWDEKLLKVFGVKKNYLPTIINNDTNVGTTNILKQPINIIGLIADQQSSLLGQGCIKKGSIKNTYGTGSFILANTGSKIIYSKNKLLSTVAYSINNKTFYALEGSIFTTGALINYLINKKKLAKDLPSLIKLAKQVKDNKSYLVPALNGLGAPYWDMSRKLEFIGNNKDKFHWSNAAFNAIAFRTTDIVNAIKKDLKLDIHNISVDGGLSQCEYLMQLQANALQMNVNVVESESTCLGCAFIVGLACGVYKNINEIKKLVNNQKTYLFKPDKYNKTKLLAWRRVINHARKVH